MQLEAAIRAAATAELAEHGLHATTIEGVAKRARTGKASVYRRWPSKDALVLDLIHGLADRHLPPADQDCDAQPPTAAALADLTHAAIQDMSQDLAELAWQLWTAPHRCPTRIATTFHDQFRRPLSDAVTRVIERETQPSETPDSASATLLADIIVLLILDHARSTPPTRRRADAIISGLTTALMVSRPSGCAGAGDRNPDST